MKDQLKSFFTALAKTLGVNVDEKKADIEKAIDELKLEPSHSPASNPVPREVLEQINALAQQNKQLFDALVEEKKAREASQKTIAEQMKKDKDTKIAKTLEDAKKAGKITPAQEAVYKKLLDTDFDSTVAIIDALPVNPTAAKPAKGGDSKAGDTKNAPANDYFANKASYIELAQNALRPN